MPVMDASGFANLTLIASPPVLRWRWSGPWRGARGQMAAPAA